MKQKLVICFTFVILLGIFVVCSKTKNIKLAFKAEDIDYVEMYSFVMPTEAEKKIIIESKDIEQIISSISQLEKKGDASAKDETVGGNILSLRFKLKNEGSMEVIYNDSGVITSSCVVSYKTEGESMNKLWDSLDYEIKKANINELPTIER